jgi:hypothetical protein
MALMKNKVAKLFLSILCCLFLIQCASYEKFRYLTEDFEMPSEIYNADYNQAWQAVLQVMKKFDLALKNQESGVIRTHWIENTSELNFSDSFGSSDAVKSAKFKITVNVVRGYRTTREVSKITIQKRQLIEQDFLQGWKEIPSDGIQERTLLYRVKKYIDIDNQLKAIEKKKEQEQLKNF